MDKTNIDTLYNSCSDKSKECSKIKKEYQDSLEQMKHLVSGFTKNKKEKIKNVEQLDTLVNNSESFLKTNMKNMDGEKDKMMAILEKLNLVKNNYNKMIKNDSSYNNIERLENIVNDTKEIITEEEFSKLKNEQSHLMSEYYDLEKIKKDPFSDNALEFTKDTHFGDKKKTFDMLKSNFDVNEPEDFGNVIQKKQEQIKSVSSQPPAYNITINDKQNKVQPSQMPCQQPVQQSCQQPCQQPYFNRSNFVGLPSIQIVNVDTSSEIKKKEEIKKIIEKKDRELVVKLKEKEKELKQKPTIRNIRNKIKKNTKKRKYRKKKCKSKVFIPSYSDRTENHNIFKK